MIEYDRKNWVRAVFSFRGTALRRAGIRVVVLTAYAIVVQAIYEFGVAQGWHLTEFFGLSPREHVVLGSLRAGATPASPTESCLDKTLTWPGHYGRVHGTQSARPPHAFLRKQ